MTIKKGVVDSWEELRYLAEQIWDANQNGTLANLRKERKPDYVWKILGKWEERNWGNGSDSKG